MFVCVCVCARMIARSKTRAHTQPHTYKRARAHTHTHTGPSYSTHTHTTHTICLNVLTCSNLSARFLCMLELSTIRRIASLSALGVATAAVAAVAFVAGALISELMCAFVLFVPGVRSVVAATVLVLGESQGVMSSRGEKTE